MAWNGTLIDFRGDGVSFTGAADSDTTPTFYLLGGRYMLETHSTGTAGAQLQIKSADGSFINIGSAAAANAPVTLDLPPGTYQIVMGGAAGTAGGSLVRVPYRAA